MKYPTYTLVPFVISTNCDSGFAIGVKEFQRILFANSPFVSYSFTSREFSIKTLIKNHLTSPLELFLSSYYGEKDREIFEDFKLSKVSNYFDSRTDLTAQQNAYDSLEHWSRELHQFARSCDAREIQVFDPGALDSIFHPTHDETNIDESCNSGIAPSLQDHFYGTLDTLKLLIERLKPFRSNVSTVPGSSNDKSSQLKTIHRIPYGMPIPCKLCWRVAEIYKASKQVNRKELSNLSNEYCSDHSLNGEGSNSPNWSRYLRGRRLLDCYNREHEYVSGRYRDTNDDGNYVIKGFDIKTFIDTRRGYILSPTGASALAYYLVRSGLHKNKFQRVHKARHDESLNNKQIAKKFGLTVKAVDMVFQEIRSKTQSVIDKTVKADSY